MKVTKTVTIKDIIWNVLSANERSCTHGGRHFFASRCSSKTPWYLREHDCDITTSATGAFELSYLPFRLETRHLSLAVLDATSHPSVMQHRGVERTALIHLVELPTTEYLTRIGVITAYAARPADLLPKYVQLIGRGGRLSQ